MDPEKKFRDAPEERRGPGGPDGRGRPGPGGPGGPEGPGGPCGPEGPGRPGPGGPGRRPEERQYLTVRDALTLALLVISSIELGITLAKLAYEDPSEE